MAESLAELQTMLTEVRSAISKCLTAQEYTSGPQMGLKRPTLEQLEKREQMLLGKIAGLESDGSTSLVQFEAPT